MRIRPIMSAVLCAVAVIMPLCAQSTPLPLVNNPPVPAAVAPGSGGFTLTLNGTGFVAGSVVNWNRSPRATTFVSSSQVTATITAADVASAGTASVTVVNPGPGGGSSNVAFLPVTASRMTIAFADAAAYQLDSPYEMLAAGDFNGDGRLDLAAGVYNGSAFSVAVLLGKGDGTFQQPAGPFIGTCCGKFLAVGDFNGDGNLDVVTLTNSPNFAMSVLLGNGDGTLGPPKNFPIDGDPESVGVGDFNGDGNLDVIVAYSGNASGVDVLLGKGDGTFRPAISSSINSFPYYLTVGDFNSDGILDVAVATDGGVAVLPGKGDGSFKSPSFIGEKLAHGLAAADFNGDGILDLIATGSKEFYVLLGKGDGTFTQGPRYKFGRRAFLQPAIGDFNGDGHLDLIFADNLSKVPDSQIFLGNGDGTFAAPIYAGPSLSGNPVVGDFNGDGQLDLASANSSIKSVLQTSLSPSPAELLFPEVPVGTTTHPLSVAITNVGPQALNISQAQVSGTDAADFSMVSNGCQGASLAPSANCTITVTLTPSAAKSRKAAILLTDNAVASPQSVVLEGAGTGIHFEPHGIDFGDVKVGSKQKGVATLVNTTPDELILHYNIEGPARADFKQRNSCGKAIKGKERCSVIITFTPGSTGTRRATLEIGTEGYPRAELKLTGKGN